MSKLENSSLSSGQIWRQVADPRGSISQRLPRFTPNQNQGASTPYRHFPSRKKNYWIKKYLYSRCRCPGRVRGARPGWSWVCCRRWRGWWRGGRSPLSPSPPRARPSRRLRAPGQNQSPRCCPSHPEEYQQCLFLQCIFQNYFNFTVSSVLISHNISG